MRCLMLLTFLVLAMMAISAKAGKVTINGACVDCNRPNARTTTTHRTPAAAAAAHGGRGHGRQTTPRPRPKAGRKDSDEDDWNFSLSQDAHGGQHITSGGRHRRQWGGRQVILTDPGYGGGSWSGGRVTTLDARGRPGVLVHNDDCVGCNING